MQERNRKKNLELKEQHKKKSLAGMNKKVALDESDDDAQWFRQEVGTDPEKGMLFNSRKRCFESHIFRLRVAFQQKKKNG